MKIPGKQYLIEIQDCKEYPKDEKCEHKKGYWLVEADGRLFKLIRNSQFEKDIWLDEAREQVGEAAALKLLRWYCMVCGTVQMP